MSFSQDFVQKFLGVSKNPHKIFPKLLERLLLEVFQVIFPTVSSEIFARLLQKLLERFSLKNIPSLF